MKANLTLRQTSVKSNSYSDIYGDLTSIDVTSDYTCESSSLRLFTNTTDTTITITFQPDPKVNDIMEVVNAANSFETNHLFINGNGKKVMGSLDLLIVDVNSSLTFCYHPTYGQRAL